MKRLLTTGAALLMLCVAWMLPAPAVAQQLTRYEYWFDNNIGSRHAGSLSGSIDEINLDIDTDGLSDGLHVLHLRVKRSDGKYSSIMSSTFLKFITGRVSMVEYWVDDDRDNLVRLPGTVHSSGHGIVLNQLLDMNSISPGMHRLNYRGVCDGGTAATAVNSSYFLKRLDGTITDIEYWVDNDRDGAVRVPCTTASTGNAYILNKELDMTAVSPGMHKLNYRGVGSGSVSTAIASSYFMKQLSGKVTMLEYWVDNRQNVTRVPLSTASTGKGLTYTSELNLGAVSPGMHHLYYRGVGNGNMATAVGVTPVMVKSQYHSNEQEEAKVVKYSMTVDDETPIVANVSRPGPEVVINNKLNLRDLQPGEHRVTVQAWNNRGMSVSESGNFTVPQPAPVPDVTLTAQENSGLVTLRFNSLPNDVSWKLIRTDASGATATVRSAKKGSYPDAVTVVDNPINGQYTYRARVYYTNNEGTQVAVNSNSVNLTMTNADQVRYGTISGLLKVQTGPTLNHDWVVKYSDNDNIVDHADALGTFVRDRVPVGTQVTISAEDVAEEGYTFTSKTITVQEGRNDVVLIGNFDVEKVKNSYSHDLEFASRVEFTPGQFMKFKVRNVTRSPWYGKIRIASVKKEYLERALDETGIGTGGDAQVGTGSTLTLPSFTTYNDYDDDYSGNISVGNQPVEVNIKHNLSSMRGDKDEYYYFFVYSVDSKNHEKLIGTNWDYNIKDNPIEQLVSKNDWAASQQQVLEEDIEYAVNIILSMMKKAKEIDGYMGNVEKGLSFFKSNIEDEVIYEALNSNSWEEFVAKYPKESVTNIAYEANVDLLNIVHSVRDKVSTLVRGSKDILKVIKGAKKTLDEIKLANSVWENNNELEVAAYVTEKILDLSDDVFPLAPVLKSYLDITKKTVYNVLNLVDKWATDFEYRDFINDKYTFIIDIKRTLTWQDIDDLSPLWDGVFYQSYVEWSIDEVVVDCVAETNTGGKIASKATYKPKVKEFAGVPRYCYLERVPGSFDGQSNDGVGENAIRDMRMTIYWRNGRVTHVPIGNSRNMRGNGVKYNSRTYTITFKSETCNRTHLADIIHLDD